MTLEAGSCSGDENLVFIFFLKSLTKGLFDPSEGDRKFKS